MKLSLILEAIDRATGPVRRVTASVHGLAHQGMKPLEQSMRRVQGVERTFLSGLPARVSHITANVRQLAGRAGMGALRISALGAASALRSVVGLAGRLAAGGLAIGTVGAGLLGGWLTGGVIGQASKFEQFRVILENTEGSAEAARKAMAWVKDFAVSTPYEIGDVMEAFVKLKAYGIDPTNGSLRALGDAASGMGKDLNAAVEMLADAQTGEFERIKEFGVRASVQGDKVRLTYMRAGKEVTKVAKNSGSAIQAALLGIFGERFANMMDRQSRTFKGMWSNIGDAFTFFQLGIADAGFFDAVKNKLKIFLGWINKISADGTLKRWAATISKWLTTMTERAYDFVTNINWNDVATRLKGVAKVLWEIAGVLSTIIDLAERASKAVDHGRALLPKWMQGSNPIDQGFRFTTPGMIWNFGKHILGYDAPVAPKAAPRQLPRSSPPAANQRGGMAKISLHVTTDRGVSITPTRLEARGVGLDLNTGRAMSSIA